MTTADFRHDKVVRHTHSYSLTTERPADVMATAEKEAESFLNGDGVSNAAAVFSDIVTKVSVNNKTGEMFAYWIQAGEENEAPVESSADSVTTAVVNLYSIKAEDATASNVRAVLDAAEKDAMAFAESNNLEYRDDIVAVSQYGDEFAVIWSTESDD